jgi:hypothetical protein
MDRIPTLEKSMLTELDEQHLAGWSDDAQRSAIGLALPPLDFEHISLHR